MPDTPSPASPYGSKSRDYLAEMMNALTAAAVVIDAEGNVLAANKAWAVLTAPQGKPDPTHNDAPSLLRRCLPHAMGPRQMEMVAEGIQAVIDGTVPEFRTEFETRIENGSRWFRVEIRPFAIQRAAVMMVCQDVSEQREARQALKESQGHLYQAQKMEALGTLVAGVAHEINNPISLIMFNLPIVRRVWQDLLPMINPSVPSATSRKYGGFSLDYLQSHFGRLIDDMDMAANRVSKIVRDLKHFSRQSHVSEKEPLQVNEAVTNAVRLARTTIQKTGVDLSLALGEELPVVIGNLPSIEQIVLNILINAAQAIDGGQGRIKIKTGIRKSDGFVFVAITDNGRGVSPAIADKIFDPFVTDKQNSGGTGLGLAVSYSLVQAHHGAITFETADGEGTTFTIWLPSGQVTDMARVLVVDDDAAVRKLIVQLLKKRGRYQVEEAVSGVDGLLRIGTTTPDLLILDLKMPGMNGLEVCRAVRGNDQLTKMKVLITTGHPHHPDLTEIRAMGYTDCYTKPIRVDRFADMVETMMAAPAAIE
jgi:signal transduction histidine kinase/CheY-like chemotaxis protein